jgi:predicted flap endonuclease-1-like 5' DNA nuclease
VLLRYPSIRVTLTGHIAIRVGSEADAVAFSARRAQAVADALAAAGVDAERLDVMGPGLPTRSPTTGLRRVRRRTGALPFSWRAADVVVHRRRDRGLAAARRDPRGSARLAAPRGPAAAAEARPALARRDRDESDVVGTRVSEVDTGGSGATRRVVTDETRFAPPSARDRVAEVASRTAGGLTPPRDDLVRIHGVGPKIAELLVSRGITSFRQVARLRPEDIEVRRRRPRRLLRPHRSGRLDVQRARVAQGGLRQRAVG